MKESDLQKQCIEYLSILALQHKELFYFAPLNETAMQIMIRFKVSKNIRCSIINFLKKMGLMPGIPDLQILYKGNSIFVELKAEGKLPNETQNKIHFKLMLAGFKTYVIDCFDDFKILTDKFIMENNN